MILNNINKFVLNRLGLSLERKQKKSYPNCTFMLDTTKSNLSKKLVGFNKFIKEPKATNFIAESIEEFFDVWPDFPFKETSGGCAFNTALLLFVASKAFDPNLIIESGTLRGQSSWVFRKACPDAEIHCFDLSFSNLVFEDKNISYHENDWMLNPLTIKDPKKTLVYFDDHVSQGQRINEAHKLGIKNIILDDNLPVHTLHGDGLPPVPTVDIIMDKKIQDGQQIKWVSEEQNFTYVHDFKFCERIRNKIETIYKLPSIKSETGYALETVLTCVRLRSG